MKKISLLLGVTAMAFAASATALPQTKYTASCKPLAPTEGEYPESKVGSITSQSAFKKITAANEAYADGKHSESIAMLRALIAETGDKIAAGRAQFLLGVNYNAIEQYSSAIGAFRKALDSGFLIPRDEANIRMSIARSYLIQEDYNNALVWMKRYFDSVIKPPASAYASYSQIFYQTERFRESICPAYIALQEGYSSKKGMYGMLFGAHYKLNDWAGAEVIGEEMVELFPKKESAYNNLFAVYSRREKQKDMLALAELARMNGLWRSETNYKQLSALFANNKVPRLAAERLKEGIEVGAVESTEDNWKRVANNYFFAKDRENAIDAYNKASSFTSSGRYDYKIAIMYQDSDDYAKAAAKYKEAIRKGNLRDGDMGYALMNLGVSQFRLGQDNAAIATMKRASGYSNVSKNARAYINYIEQLQKMEKAIAAMELADDTPSNEEGE